MKLNYFIGTDREIKEIHEYTLKLLSEVGAVFHSKEAVDIFKKHGAKVENEIVFIDKKMFENAFKTVPPTFDWYGRDTMVTIGSGGLKCSPTYGPIYIYKEGKYENANHTHFVNFHKLNETSSIMDISSCNTMYHMCHVN